MRNPALDAWGDYDRDDPYPLFAQVQADGPVHEVTLADGHRAWLIAGHEEAKAALNHAGLSKDMHAALARDGAVVAEGLPGPAFARHMLSVDPPDHTRLRRLTSAAFSRPRIAALRPRVQTIVDRLLDDLEARGDTVVDLVKGFAFPLPFTVISELLGVPEPDRDQLGSWFTTLLAPSSAPEPPAAASEELSDLDVPKPPKQRKRLPSWHWPPSKRELIIAGTMLILLIASGTAGWVQTHKNVKVIANHTKTHYTKPKPPAPTTVASTLSGLQVDKSVNQRPVTGVMIENSPDARPQSGLDQASVVFEAIAEGGITRFLTLFQDTQPDYLGPVRSARPYYVQWCMGFDCSLAHVGGSPEALADIPAWGTKNLDQFANSGSFQRLPPCATRSARRPKRGRISSRSAAPTCKTPRRSRWARNGPAMRECWRMTSSGSRPRFRECTVWRWAAQQSERVSTRRPVLPRRRRPRSRS